MHVQSERNAPETIHSSQSEGLLPRPERMGLYKKQRIECDSEESKTEAIEKSSRGYQNTERRKMLPKS